MLFNLFAYEKFNVVCRHIVFPPPPVSTKNGCRAEVGEDFVETLRLEILREAIEDYNYLALLK